MTGTGTPGTAMSICFLIRHDCVGAEGASLLCQNSPNWVFRIYFSMFMLHFHSKPKYMH